MDEKRKILVTGSNGLLGQKLTDLYLTLPGVTYIATSAGANRYPHQRGFEYRSMDITNHDEVKKVIAEFRPNTIINTAAMTNVDACETERELCTALNVDAVENMAIICRDCNIHFIHLSTDFIFPGTKPMYTETDKPEPLSFYGKSKLLGEQKILETGGNWSILRTVIVFGVAHKLSRSNTVQWAYDTLKNGKPAKVVNDQFRTPTLAEDLAMGCHLAEQKMATGIFNICGKDFMSILELVQRVAAHFKFSMDAIEVVSSASLNQPAKRPPITGLDITKARNVLGYEPHSFDQALDIFYQQLLAN